jgi:palmitoyl-protein thioesterase
MYKIICINNVAKRVKSLQLVLIVMAPTVHVVLLVACAIYVLAHKPILVMHGIAGYKSQYQQLLDRLSQNRTDTKIFYLEANEGLSSVFHNLNDQLKEMIKAINKVKQANNITAHHLLCHSQGGLLCRIYLMTHEHDCDTFVSVAGQHMGQYGGSKMAEKWVPFLKYLSQHEAWRVLYHHDIQKYLSIANLWNDPFHQKKYLKKNVFIPHYNNPNKTQAATYRKNFLRLKRVMLYGSKDDDIIEPWQSSILGFWNTTKHKYHFDMVDMKDQEIYLKDLFGMKTMVEAGSASVQMVPGVKHQEWVDREDIFNKYLDPLFD